MGRFLTLAACALALTLPLAACGGEEVGAPLGDAAALAPASAKAFVVLRTDRDADETKQALELLKRFPAIAEHELELERDVLPALGPEAALVLLDDDEWVALAQPEDRKKLDELLARADEPPVTREIDGWTAIAEEAEALAAFERGRDAGTLAEDDDFSDAFDDLPDDAVAKAWTSSAAQQGVGRLVAAVTAEDDGLHFEGRRTPEESDPRAETFEPELLERVPAGSALVASFLGPEGLAEQLERTPLPPGLKLEELAPILEGEGVLYVRRAALIPELTLLTEVEDEQAAISTVQRLLGLVAPQLGAEPGMNRLQLGPVALQWGARDGVLALTTSTAGLGVLDETEDKLTDDPAFEDAAERADLPDEGAGFLYAQLGELVPMLEGLASMSGSELPPDARQNLAPLGVLLLHAGRDGDDDTFGGFFEIRSR